MGTPTESTQVYQPLEADAPHPVTYSNRSVRVDNPTNQAISERTSPTGSLQNAENEISTTSANVSGVAEEPGSPRTHREDHNSSLFSPHPPFISLPPTESEEVKVTTTLWANNSSSLDSELNFEDVKLQTTLNLQTPTTASTSFSFQNINSARTTPQNQRELIQDQTSSISIQIQGSSPHPSSSLNSSQFPHLEPLVQSEISSLESVLNLQTSSSKPSPQKQTSSPNSKSPASQSTSTVTQAHPSSSKHLFNKDVPTLDQFLSHLHKTQTERFESISGPKQTSPPHPQLQTFAPITPPHQKLLISFPKEPSQTIPTQPRVDHPGSNLPPEASSTSSQPKSQTEASSANTFKWKTSKPSVATGSYKPSLFTPESLFKDLQSLAKIKTTSPSSPSTTPSAQFSTQQSTRQSSSAHSLPTASVLHRSSVFTSGGPTVSMRPSLRSTSFSQSTSSVKKQPKTVPAPSALPSPSPISIPPHFPSAQLSSSSSSPSSSASSINSSFNSSNYPSPTPSLSPVPLSTLLVLPSSQRVTDSTFPIPSSTLSPILSSSINFFHSSISSTTPPSTYSSSPSTSTSELFLLDLSSSVFFQSTTPHPGPSPAPRRSLYIPPLSSSSPVPSQKLTVAQKSTNSEPDLIPAPPRTAGQPKPELHPNINPNLQNSGLDLKPNLPDTKPKHPPDPSEAPDNYPDIVPRHSAWELGMLLGCSAGLGMVLVVWMRCMYRQACGKQTQMTLNDREREYGRGERGLIHVQECGDLVRVRRIRENSFVLLAEYDILSSPGD